MTVLGERASVLVEFGLVHVGAGELAMRKASAARPGSERARAWERAAVELEKAAAEFTQAAAAARARAGEG